MGDRAVFAHIMGIPLEETALSLAPVAMMLVACAGLRLRRALTSLATSKVAMTRDERKRRRATRTTAARG